MRYVERSELVVVSDLRRDLPLALVAAATTWLTMVSWRGFSSDSAAFLEPLLVVALTVPLGGVAVRAAPVSRRAGPMLHLLVVMAVVWLVLGGSLIHPIASTSDIDLAFHHAWVSASMNAAPVPATVPSIAPLMIVCGAGALVLVDVLACWLRRVPLAGLPLLAVYGAPIIALDDAASWPVFVIAAVGFLLMMFFQESSRISRWGRPLGGTAAVDPTAFGVRRGASRASAGAVGGVAVMLAVIVPVFIPTLHLDLPHLFGPAGSGDVQLTNPMASMRRDLHRGQDVPLLDVITDNPDPSYLRIAVLTRFDGMEWTTGDRPAVSRVTDRPLPLLEQGLPKRVPEKTYHYTVTATDAFDSTWLPTQFPASDIVAPGAWHYDRTTMDVFAGDSDTNARGITYQMTAAVPRLSARAMTRSMSAPARIQSTYTHLPDDAREMRKVHRFAVRATHGTHNRYQIAVRLQNWFRNTGGFQYDIHAQADDGDDALVRFLTRGNGGRVGYCEQFASAYAAMARTLGVPARVAVGFLQPTRGANGDWIYGAWDLHAWPELYFQGSGWVRFEPTPSDRAGTVPAYTVTSAGGQTSQSHEQTTGSHDHLTNHATRPTPTPQPTTTVTTSSTSPGSHVTWAALAATLGVLVVIAALALIPGTVRRSRRARRLTGGAEDAWAELRDTAVDLGVGWPVGRSPQETRARLTSRFDAEPDGAPPTGPGRAPDAEVALDRIVLMLEQVRYARSAYDVPGALAGDVRTCLAALEHGCSRGSLFRARWFPRSVTALSAAMRRSPEHVPEGVSPGGVHDRVGPR